MSFNKFFQDELTYLRELGKEFSHSNPQLAPFLAERGSDPDVERLLEGFAFLTGRLTQKLNDQLPEFTHSMIDMMWPHYLRPIPSMSVIEFSPVANAMTEVRSIDSGVELDSVSVEGTRCRFRTSYTVDVTPLNVVAAKTQLDARGQSIVISFKALPGVSLAELQLKKLRLYIHGDPYVTQSLYLSLCQYLSAIKVTGNGDKALQQGINLPEGSLRPVGFNNQESLFDYGKNVFSGYRLLQEYFAYPDKFMFFEVDNLSVLRNADGEFSIELLFSQPLEEHVRVSAAMFRLNCSPACNLFKRDADPIRSDKTSMDYRVRPSSRNVLHYDVYSIDKVESRIQGMSKTKTYSPVASFAHEEQQTDNAGFYTKHLRKSVTGNGFETYISFGEHKMDGQSLTEQTVSVELTCTNRRLPEQLKVGDIKAPTSSTPEYVTFANITAPTPTVYPDIDSDLQWKLISNMALNYSSLTNIDMLRSILRTYDFRAMSNRQAQRQLDLKLEGIRKVEVQTADRLIKGLPIRGVHITMTLKESHFVSEGDMYLFACVMNQFFSLYASINSYHLLTVIGEEKGEHYQWPLKMGLQNTL